MSELSQWLDDYKQRHAEDISYAHLRDINDGADVAAQIRFANDALVQVKFDDEGPQRFKVRHLHPDMRSYNCDSIADAESAVDSGRQL